MGKIACDLKSFFSKTKKRKWEMGLSALDRSLHISHGREPVDFGGRVNYSPGRAKDSWACSLSVAPLGLERWQTRLPRASPVATLYRRYAAVRRLCRRYAVVRGCEE